MAYRPPAAWYQRLNWLGVAMTSLGLAPRGVVTLEVRGRRSGKPRRLAITTTRFEGDDHLVALAGESQWVRNVRAASGRAVIQRVRRRPVVLEELPVENRAPVIQAYIEAGRDRGGERTATNQAVHYFGVSPDASLDGIRAIAHFYPVFRIAAAASATTTKEASWRS